MSKEEKKAIEDCKEFIEYLKNTGGLYYRGISIKKITEILLNLIEKLKKENELQSKAIKCSKCDCSICEAHLMIEELKEQLKNSIPKDKIIKLEDMWNDNIWNATDEASKEKAEMIRDVYRGLLDE